MIQLWQELFLERRKDFLINGLGTLGVGLFAWFIFQRVSQPTLHANYPAEAHIGFLMIYLIAIFISENEALYKNWKKARLRLLPLTPTTFILGSLLYSLVSFVFWGLVAFCGWFALGSAYGIVAFPTFSSLLLLTFLAIEIFVGMTTVFQAVLLVAAGLANLWQTRGRFLIQTVLVIGLLLAFFAFSALVPGNFNVATSFTADSFSFSYSFRDFSTVAMVVSDLFSIIISSALIYFSLTKLYEAA